MPFDMKRQARANAARKVAAEMSQDAATEHLPDEPEAVDSPLEESTEPADLTPEEAQKLSGLAALLK
jgi:hypothetical protein